MVYDIYLRELERRVTRLEGMITRGRREEDCAMASTEIDTERGYDSGFVPRWTPAYGRIIEDKILALAEEQPLSSPRRALELILKHNLVTPVPLEEYIAIAIWSLLRSQKLRKVSGGMVARYQTHER